jgi:hypothetical protein
VREFERSFIPIIPKSADTLQILSLLLTKQHKGDDQCDWIFESTSAFDEDRLDLDELELSVESLLDEIFG